MSFDQIRKDLKPKELAIAYVWELQRMYSWEISFEEAETLADVIESIPENETLSSRVKGSMSLYIYKKLGEWLGAPCNLSFGELHVNEFFTYNCGDFCDYCNSEYEKCWKKFFETLEEKEVNDERGME